jgi:phosphinothricin acetyltransferase
MQVDLARDDDLPVINEIYNQAVGELFCTAHLTPVDMAYRRRWFKAHPPDRYPVFVAREATLVTGWISLGPYRPGRQALDHVAEVSYYVDANYRNRGIGRALITHAIDAARDRGLTVLVAILLDRNPASIGLLEKFGFQRWGTMPGIARIGTETADHLYFGMKI